MNATPFTSIDTMNLTFAQHSRIIQDLFHPETKEEIIEATSKYISKADYWFTQWLEDHTLSEISGKAIRFKKK